VITDGEWTSTIGNQQLSPADQNPSTTALNLYTNHNVKTHVMTLGEAFAKAFANELAMAGGTVAAIHTRGPDNFALELESLIFGLEDSGVILKVCSG